MLVGKDLQIFNRSGKALQKTLDNLENLDIKQEDIEVKLAVKEKEKVIQHLNALQKVVGYIFNRPGVAGVVL